MADFCVLHRIKPEMTRIATHDIDDARKKVVDKARAVPVRHRSGTAMKESGMNPNGSLSAGKVACVTGAASGIGRAAALAFASAGASVAVGNVSGDSNREAARLIQQQGGRAVAGKCDVARAEDVRVGLEKTVEAFGRLDVVFNNAGIEPRKPAPTADYDEDEWNRIIDVDLPCSGCVRMRPPLRPATPWLNGGQTVQ